MTPTPTDRLFSVAGKVVLITGGSSGIGAMIAAGFAQAGARVYVTGRHAERLEATRAEIAKLGEVRTIQADLAEPGGIDAVVRSVASREPRLDALFNNAGTTWGGALETFPPDGWDSVFATNVRAPFVLLQGLLSQLEAAATDEDPARVVNIGSVYGQSSKVMNAWSYAASKAALHHLTKALAAELAPRRILVNAIAPGFFPSRMTAFVLKDEGRHASMLADIPLNRAGKADDVAGLALYLCTRASAYITGTVIPLDGGFLARR